MSASVLSYSHDIRNTRSPDDLSPMMPDRPIKALPKRTLRERLSPEVASTIHYPPAPKISAPIFQYPYSHDGRPRVVSDRDVIEEFRRRQRLEDFVRLRDEGTRVELRNGDYDNSYAARLKPVHANDEDTRGSSEAVATAYRYVQKVESPKTWETRTSTSAASSVDGYESFENSNNKKKRKIPTPGDGINGIQMLDNATSSHYCPDDSNYPDPFDMASPIVRSTFSGPGRGRYVTDTAQGRSPMHSLSDANGRAPKQRQQHSSESTGIISAAIAQAEKLPATSTKGQENISLLASVSRHTPSSTHFTFTCDPQIPATPWPLSNHLDINDKSYKGTDLHETTPAPDVDTMEPVTSSVTEPQQSSVIVAPQPRRRIPRRRTRANGSVANVARREYQRRYLHQRNIKGFIKPTPEDWCPFCTYEMWTGGLPTALIRESEQKEQELAKLAAQRKKKRQKAQKGGKTHNKRANDPKSITHEQGDQVPDAEASQTDVTFEGGDGTLQPG